MDLPDRTSRSRERSRERRKRRRRRFLKWAGAFILVAVVFFAGLAVGKVVENSDGTHTQTSIRTLVPTALTPLQTVTVTVSKP